MATVRSAAAAPPSADHVVHLHDGDSSYFGGVVPYLAGALAAGHAAVAIVTDEHAEGIAIRLTERGVDVGAATERGQLVLVDARAVAAAVAPGDRADDEAFAALIAARIDRALAEFPQVAAMGEVVDLLAADGRTDTALDLERLWNQLMQTRRMSLWCAYHVGNFADSGSAAGFARVCAAHGDAHPLPIGAGEAGTPRSMLARLQQQALALRTEVAERRALEGRAGHLYALTAALGRCATPTAVAAVALDAVCELAGARAAQLQRITDDGSREVLAAHGMIDGYAAHVGCQLLAVGVISDEPRDVVAMGLTVGERRTGEIVLGFAPPRRFPGRDRDLFAAIGDLVGQALERTRLAEDARDARERLDRAEQQQDELLSRIGHELRNPLAAILTAAQLMGTDDGPAPAEASQVPEMSRRIERQAQHLGRMVGDLLDTSRLGRGALRLDIARHELAPLVAWALEIHGRLIEQRGHAVTVDVEPDLPRVEVDAERMAQVVAHLVGNAARAIAGAGRIAITVRRDDGDIELAVADSGAGITAAELPRVFDPFGHGAPHGDGGLGLGLALARDLTELHGGTLTATSDGPGAGSTFRVRIPVDGRAGAVDRTALRRPMRILVVDDNGDAATLLAGALRQRGHRVAVAHDGPSALTRAMSFGPEVVVLDIGLPGLDGLEVARRLRAAGSPARLVAVTGYGMPADHAASRDAGFDLHLVKPVSLAAIEDAIASPRA